MTQTMRGPGRPRDASIDAAILEATTDELIERGYIALSIEAIAARAGVAKTTVYRRWPNTEELVLAAMRMFERDDQSPPPDGSAREQLAVLLDRMRRKWVDPRYGAMMRRVTADGTASPDLYRHVRDRLIGPHIALMDRALRQAVDEGLIRPDADLGWARQMITSPIMAATLTHRDRVSRSQVEFSLDTVLRGLAP